MKSNIFNHSLLAVGVAAVLGLASPVNAATSAADSTPTIDNFATATYSIDDIPQAAVKSNTVRVNITQSAAFSLEAKNEDNDPHDDFNKAITVTPMGRVAFNHTLTNTGNLQDTYTMSLVQGGTIPGITPQGAGS